MSELASSRVKERVGVICLRPGLVAGGNRLRRKLKAMLSIIWSIGADRFGTKELKGSVNPK